MRRDWKPKGTCWLCAENRLTVIDIIVKWNVHRCHHVSKRVAVNNLMSGPARKFQVRRGWALPVMFLGCRMKIKTKTSFRTLFKDWLRNQLDVTKLDLSWRSGQHCKTQRLKEDRTAASFSCYSAHLGSLHDWTLCLFWIRWTEWGGSTWEMNQSVIPPAFGFFPVSR